ncbi:hypothetical protein [Streptomyces sp. NPDC014622]|uniref:hypothetical protein n=1 Tax=Streptomyces sp. NPDC014622 TaxID=3364874 RepID=UPI003701ED4C
MRLFGITEKTAMRYVTAAHPERTAKQVTPRQRRPVSGASATSRAAVASGSARIVGRVIDMLPGGQQTVGR